MLPSCSVIRALRRSECELEFLHPEDQLRVHEHASSRTLCDPSGRPFTGTVGLRLDTAAGSAQSDHDSPSARQDEAVAVEETSYESLPTSDAVVWLHQVRSGVIRDLRRRRSVERLVAPYVSVHASSSCVVRYLTRRLCSCSRVQITRSPSLGHSAAGGWSVFAIAEA